MLDLDRHDIVPDLEGLTDFEVPKISAKTLKCFIRLFEDMYQLDNVKAKKLSAKISFTKNFKSLLYRHQDRLDSKNLLKLIEKYIGKDDMLRIVSEVNSKMSRNKSSFCVAFVILSFAYGVTMLTLESVLSDGNSKTYSALGGSLLYLVSFGTLAMLMGSGPSSEAIVEIMNDPEF